jgi:hypothetical protein
MNTSSKLAHFVPLASWLHCLMALGLLAMLFIGAGMVASVSERHEWLIICISRWASPSCRLLPPCTTA